MQEMLPMCGECEDGSCDWCADTRTALLRRRYEEKVKAAERRLDALSRVLDASEMLVVAARWTPMRPRVASAVEHVLQTVLKHVGKPGVLRPPPFGVDDLCSLCYGRADEDRESCERCAVRRKEREAAIRDFESEKQMH